MREERTIHVPKGKMRAWWFLSHARVWTQFLSAAVGPYSEVGKTVYRAYARSGNRLDVPVEITVFPQSETETKIEVSLCDSVSYHGWHDPGPILPRPKRKTDAFLGCSPGFGASKAEEDPREIALSLKKIADEFEDTALRLSESERNYLVAIPIVTETNWPQGCFQFGSRFLFCTVYESFKPHLGLYAKIVRSSSSEEALAAHHAELLNEVKLLNIVAGRYITAANSEQAQALGSVKQGQFPRAERETGSKLLDFLKDQEAIGTYDPYSEVKGMERVFKLPNDLEEFLVAYENLSADPAQVLNRALNALHLCIKVSSSFPTVAVTALWTALETLVDIDPRIKKSGPPCEKCRQTKSSTQDAIMDLLSSRLKFSESERVNVANVLMIIRKNWRIAWVHRGNLPGRDFEAREEVWFAHSEKTAPDWTRSDYLLTQGQDFVRQVIISFLEEEREQLRRYQRGERHPQS